MELAAGPLFFGKRIRSIVSRIFNIQRTYSWERTIEKATAKVGSSFPDRRASIASFLPFLTSVHLPNIHFAKAKHLFFEKKGEEDDYFWLDFVS